MNSKSAYSQSGDWMNAWITIVFPLKYFESVEDLQGFLNAQM